jgi:hypothetical protein
MTSAPLDCPASRLASNDTGLAKMKTQNTKIRRQNSGTAGRPLLSGLVVMLVALLLTACATTGGGGGGNVADRAQARWDALLAGDFETAYGYYTPGFRSSHSVADFELSQRLRKVQFRGAEYVDQECDGDTCTLKFSVDYHIASPVPGLDEWKSKTTLDEQWVRTQGQWWYFPND